MSSRSTPWFVRRVPREQPKLRLFLFPYAGGGSVIFRGWENDFPAEIDVCAVEPPGRFGRFQDRGISDVHEFAAAFERAVDPFLDVPIAFFGYSLGALMAFQCARQLRSRRQLEPTHLMVAAHRAPHMPKRLQPISGKPDAAFIQEIERRYGPFDAVIKAEREMFEAVLGIMRTDFKMLEGYDYAPEAPFACPILALGGVEDGNVLATELDGWREHTSADFRFESLPGGHFFLRESGAALRQLIRNQLAS